MTLSSSGSRELSWDGCVNARDLGGLGRARPGALVRMERPGRLERLQDRPAIYLDGSHNPAGAREVLAFWREHLSGRRIHLIYGAMRDKAIDEVAGLLFPAAMTVILTQSPQPRSLSARALAEMTSHLADGVEVIREPGAAFERALEIAAPEDVIFATGSLYLVGDLRRYWDGRSAAERAVPAEKITAYGIG